MAKPTIRLKLKEKEGVVEIRALITHPMHTGLVRTSEGDKIPAHFVNEVKIEANGETILLADWTGSVSKNPYVSVSYEGSKSDTIKLSWKDNKGEGDFLEKGVGQ